MSNVVVVGADHHNTLGVVESLAEKGIRPYVILHTKSRHSFILHSKNVQKGWRCKDESDIIKTLTENLKTSESKTIIIATSDRAACILDKNYSLLEPYFIVPTVKAAGSLERVMSKESMSSVAKKCGMNVPSSWIMKDGKIPEGIQYPVITKAISSVEGGKGDIKVCYRQKDLEDFLRENHCQSIQLQQFINKQFEFQLLGCSLNSGEEIIIPGRTNIDRPNGMDNTFFLSFDKCEEELDSLVEKAKEFVRLSQYTGPFSIEFLRDKNGIDYFTEMNFRNDGNAYCMTRSGTNIPYIYYLYYSGGDYKSELEKSQVRKVWLMPEVYYTSCLFKREFGLKEWWRNMRKSTCYTTYFSNDKAPFFFFLVWAALKRITSTKSR